MKLPINWLKDYIEVPENVSELIQKLTSIGHMQDGPPKEVNGEIVYEVEIRQNRSDCLSLLGLAREAASVTNQKLTYPQDYSSMLPENKGLIQVEVSQPELCYRFNSILIENITIGESPEWLKKKIESYGMKSINNLVDITNFVMIELGQPLHAFDVTKVKEQHIRVRKAEKDESLIVLGGQKIYLTPDDLVIADSEKALALAGVIGGEESGVHSGTTSIILEAATYNQASIRRSSIRHQLRTEASTRLEKFLHPHLTELALKRASALITELCSGIVTDHTDAYPHVFESKQVILNVSDIERLGGVAFSPEDVKTYLEKLEITSEVSGNTVTVIPPYFRTDIEQDADLIEEVLRIYGYDNIPSKLVVAPPPTDITSEDYILEEKIRDILVACGYDEQITEPLTKEEDPVLSPVVLENSLNSEKTMLRTTLLHSLKSGLDNRRKFKEQKSYIFEIGKIYFKDGDDYEESKKIGLIASIDDFSNIKGVVETLFDRLEKEYDHSAIVYKSFSENEHIYFAEIDLEKIKGSKNKVPHVLSSPLQVILNDVSLLVPAHTKVGELVHFMKENSSILYKVELGEEPKKMDDKKSVFLHLTFHAPDKTLTNEEVDKERTHILEKLQESFQAELKV